MGTIDRFSIQQNHKIYKIPVYEFAKWRVKRAYVPKWSTCQRACVPAWFTCQSACVPTCQKLANFSFLGANVPIKVVGNRAFQDTF